MVGSDTTTQSLLGASVAGQKRYQEAEPLAVDAYEALIQRKSSISPANASVMDQAGRRVIQLYRDWGKPEKAAEWAKRMGIRSSARAGQRVLPYVERECHTRPPIVVVRAADCRVAHRNEVRQARFPPKAIAQIVAHQRGLLGPKLFGRMLRKTERARRMAGRTRGSNSSFSTMQQKWRRPMPTNKSVLIIGSIQNSWISRRQSLHP